ncbi:MAG: DEAD/DEAH box helicase [Myxococcales bacterium]|nr:DEAD/DEAH box helicase [Myxococcales bacterium]
MSQTTFSRLSPRLQQAIGTQLHWTSLRPVQEEAGQALLDGENAVILAPTAGGKTEASMFPALSMLLDEPTDAVGVLYVAPIKALLNNQAERLGQYTEMVGLRRFVWHGDAKSGDKKNFTKEPAELLMTTPESLEVMLVSSRFPTPKLFRDLRMVVVDEVHAFAGSDRGAHFMSVLERLVDLTDNDVQRVGLSATVGNPEAILEWLQGTSKRAGRVVDPPKPKAGRDIAVLLRPTIADIATTAAGLAVEQKSLFFCQSRAMTESVAQRMRGRGVEVFVHHSSVSRQEREEAEKKFGHGGDACIACTSTLELGIDVGDLNKVLQANSPSSVSSFLQRMGRTGRRGGNANTTFLVENTDVVLQACAIIELAKTGWVESVPVTNRCFPVLVHQLLAMTLQFGGVTRNAAWTTISRVPDFRGVSREEFDGIVEHMIAQDYLFESSGQLSMGQKSEKVFGRKNFMELYAVFSSPVLYRVVTAAKAEIGSLEQNFVDNLVADMSAFLLGGRAWVVEYINHKERTVRVAKAPGGKKPSWGGFIPQMLSQELCQEMRRILEDDAPLSYLDPEAAGALAVYRADLGESLRGAGIVTRYEDGKVLVWTFAGGRINHTIKYILTLLGGWKVVADNLHLRLEGESVAPDPVQEIFDRMRTEAFWQDEDIWSRVYASLPEYRLSKFQPAMPEACSREMVAGYLLDVPGTKAFVQGRPPANTIIH